MNATSPAVNTNELSRAERNSITVEFEVAGAPTITDHRWLSTKKPITPYKAVLRYSSQGDGWWCQARVYGHQDSVLMNGWADYAGHTDSWPEWLRNLAVQHDPNEAKQ